jgi:hypothetical protein
MEVWSPLSYCRARCCPHTYWPGWPSAWPTCCHHARQARAAPRRCRWRSAWTPWARCCWTGCGTGAPAGWWGSPRPRSATAWTCCSARLATSASASPTAPSSPAWTTCASGFRDGPSRRGGVPGRAGHPGAAPLWWANQKVLYDPKRHPHTAQGLAISTIHGDLLWCDGGWPGSCHEHELIQLAGLGGCWTRSRSQASWTAGSAAWPGPASTGTPRSGPPHHRPAHPQAAGLQPPAGRAARAGGAVDRPSCQRLGIAPLARAAVPGPGRLPRHRRAALPWPLAAPSPHMTRASPASSIR